MEEERGMEEKQGRMYTWENLSREIGNEIGATVHWLVFVSSRGAHHQARKHVSAACRQDLIFVRRKGKRKEKKEEGEKEKRGKKKEENSSE